MDAVAAGGEVQPGEVDLNPVGGLMCRRNALPDVLDEAVTKVPAGSAVSSLARLHSIHGMNLPSCKTAKINVEVEMSLIHSFSHEKLFRCFVCVYSPRR